MSRQFVKQKEQYCNKNIAMPCLALPLQNYMDFALKYPLPLLVQIANLNMIGSLIPDMQAFNNWFNFSFVSSLSTYSSKAAIKLDDLEAVNW